MGMSRKLAASVPALACANVAHGKMRAPHNAIDARRLEEEETKKIFRGLKYLGRADAKCHIRVDANFLIGVLTITHDFKIPSMKNQYVLKMNPIAQGLTDHSSTVPKYSISRPV